MLAIQLLVFAAPVVLAKARKVVWFNDNGLYNHCVTRKGYLGPDGPWHALVTGHWSMRDNLLYIPVWPTGSLDTIMPAEEGGGVYEGHEIVNTTDGSRRVPDGVQYQWPNVRPNDYGSETPDWYLNNEMQLLWADEKDDQGYAYDSVNASVREVLNWTSPYIDTTPDEDQYQRAVGILGLGKIIGSDGERQSEELGMPPSILDQLVDDGTIATRSWFMHIGSVNPLVVPSLVLGGYESNRVLGGVGIFDFDEDWKLPRLFLIGVTLGYELGLSPFDDPVGSVWGANTYEIGTHGEGSGAPNGSVMTTPDASLPYIYLPPGVCEAAAEHLPVSWNETARLYFWEESSRSEKLTNTSAYMGFVFSDRNNQNVSIKVPLALLYLLTDPYREGVNRSTRYWPCKPWSDKADDGGPGSGLWPLGRAFLQAALIGYNYDRPRFYLAQAPGPGHGEGVVVDDNNTDRIFSAPTSFKETWRSSWEEIPGPG
ncbi:hypothetical protein CSOJ01_09484 [Colletotrichum sojae]|uniref:Uncharacterized protein n=1 Tax=Colletotrichum sojae TaxID=2175907 RepID=A0A8H6J3N5_9PEZI|nr:hypothetical protein CSOJ01_09484 [Colletotrichum sojae]